MCWFLPYINMISQRHSYYFIVKVTLCLIQRPLVWSKLYEVTVLSSIKFTNDYRRCEARAMIYSATISGGPNSFHSVPWALFSCVAWILASEWWIGTSQHRKIAVYHSAFISYNSCGLILAVWLTYIVQWRCSLSIADLFIINRIHKPSVHVCSVASVVSDSLQRYGL